MKFKLGDRVRIINRDIFHRSVSIDDKAEITSVSTDVIIIKLLTGGLLGREQSVRVATCNDSIELIAPQFKAGDKVKVKDTPNIRKYTYGVAIGTTFTLTENMAEDLNRGLYIATLRNEYGTNYLATDLELISNSNNSIESQAKEEEFKLGDTIRIIKKFSYHPKVEVGDLGIIITERKEKNICFKLISGKFENSTQCATYDGDGKITIELANKKITKEPMSYKKGDKVRCVETDSGYKGAGWKLNKEFIVERVEEASGHKFILWPENGSGVFSDSVQLVEPVTKNFNEGDTVSLTVKGIALETTIQAFTETGAVIVESAKGWLGSSKSSMSFYSKLDPNKRYYAAHPSELTLIKSSKKRYTLKEIIKDNLFVIVTNKQEFDKYLSKVRTSEGLYKLNDFPTCLSSMGFYGGIDYCIVQGYNLIDFDRVDFEENPTVQEVELVQDKPKKKVKKEFEVGDIVRIRKDSQFYTGGASNPKDISGTITSNTRVSKLHCNIVVNWSNGTHNHYRVADLELIEEQQTEKKTETMNKLSNLNGDFIIKNCTAAQRAVLKDICDKKNISYYAKSFTEPINPKYPHIKWNATKKKFVAENSTSFTEMSFGAVVDFFHTYTAAPKVIEPVLPVIDGNTGVIKGDNIAYGCTSFSVQTFKDMVKQGVTGITINGRTISDQQVKDILKYLDFVEKSKTKVKTYRFKTEAEFKKEFGGNWRNNVRHSWNDRMDGLLGKPYSGNPLNLVYVECDKMLWNISKDMITEA